MNSLQPRLNSDQARPVELGFEKQQHHQKTSSDFNRIVITLSSNCFASFEVPRVVLEEIDHAMYSGPWRTWLKDWIMRTFPPSLLHTQTPDADFLAGKVSFIALLPAYSQDNISESMLLDFLVVCAACLNSYLKHFGDVAFSLR